MNIKWNKPTAEAIVRGIVALVTLVNVIAQMLGWTPLPMDEGAIAAAVDAGYAAVSALLAGLATAWAWWKNNSVTEAAQEGDALMDEIKARAKHAVSDGSDEGA